MNENYLHFLWKNKRLPLHLIKTIDRQEIQILDVGIHNLDAGPDFFNGKILLNGVVQIGNIELHVKSSDWYIHGHHLDAAYDNVILHVVYKHDQLVFIEGVAIPTLELMNYIDNVHYHQFIGQVKIPFQIPCMKHISEVSQAIIKSQVRFAFFERIERKSSLHQPKNYDYRVSLLHFIALAFGMKINAMPFEELTNKLPIEYYLKANLHEKTAMVIGISGLLEDTKYQFMNEQLIDEWNYQKHKLDLTSLNASSWKFKGCRPHGFPTIRLLQFVLFTHCFDWHEPFWNNSVVEIRQSIQNRLINSKFESNMTFPAMSINTANSILINGIIPFIWYLSNLNKCDNLKQKAIELIELLPPEKNELLKQWKRIGLPPRNALESQGLLELYNNWCQKKQCLKCEIGRLILK